MLQSQTDTICSKIDRLKARLLSLAETADQSLNKEIKQDLLDLKQELAAFDTLLVKEFQYDVQAHQELGFNVSDIDDGEKTVPWEEFYFNEHIPLAAMVAILAKARGDVEETTYTVLERLEDSEH